VKILASLNHPKDFGPQNTEEEPRDRKVDLNSKTSHGSKRLSYKRAITKVERVPSTPPVLRLKRQLETTL
jgi:hypothetical protein